MRKKFLVVALILFSFQTFSQNFFPLDSANTWSYWGIGPDIPRDSTAFQITVVGDTIMPNGIRYWEYNSFDIFDQKYVRSDSMYVYYYNTFDSSDVPMLNLQATPGTTDTISGLAGVYTSRIDSEYPIQIFGKTITAREYSLGGLLFYDVILADGFGIISAFDYGDGIFPYRQHWEIHGCIIDDSLHGTIVPIVRQSEQQISFSLKQNYPNPFNPTTQIEFALDKTGVVSLKVFDCIGNEIINLATGLHLPGNYTVSWNAEGYASGTYFYQLKVNENSQVKRMVLLH